MSRRPRAGTAGQPVTIRATPEERAAWEQAAAAGSCPSLSSWVVGTLNANASYVHSEAQVSVLASNPGTMICRRAKNGALVSLSDGDAVGVDTNAGRWFTKCETHGLSAQYATLRLARQALPRPWTWCDTCAAAPRYCKV